MNQSFRHFCRKLNDTFSFVHLSEAVEKLRLQKVPGDLTERTVSGAFISVACVMLTGRYVLSS